MAGARRYRPGPWLIPVVLNRGVTTRLPLALHRIFALYVVGVLGIFGPDGLGESSRGLSRHWIGPIFLFLTVMVYAGIGVYGRTTDPEEYYVAGRRIPPIYNGMAAAADWMSAASFISLSGALYLQGFSAARRARRAGWPMCWAGRAAFAWWPC
jgi:cation/acetate symporter